MRRRLKTEVASKGKKKLKSDPVFEVEYLKESDEAGFDDGGYDESSGDESGSDDADSTAGDYEVDEDAKDDGVGSEEESEQDKVSYQELLIKLLREKVEKGKHKRGHIEKRTGKRDKLKVEKTKGEVAKEKGVVVKTQSRSTQKVISTEFNRIPSP
ncbi:DNA polymerase alpha catalytic subunit-like [Chenopodium quinoa]|uniref:DNA polymerase alpha catalytic subunit-like n=1 Tax=Chenopodium quinoa TaxID=63459 RepID=UPI000B78F5AA|nr:DNA polymerase alpha catalytic subunit-like [Chenopodium quinoa]